MEKMFVHLLRICFCNVQRKMIFKSIQMCGICNTVAGCVIWILAPVDNLVKRLDVLEHRIYQKRTRIVLGLEGVMFGATLFCKWEMAARSICMTFFVVTISLLMGTIKLTIYNKIDG